MKKKQNKDVISFQDLENGSIQINLDYQELFFIFDIGNILRIPPEANKYNCSMKATLKWRQIRSMDEEDDQILTEQIKLNFYDTCIVRQDTVLDYKGVDYLLTGEKDSFFLRMFDIDFGVLGVRKDLVKFLSIKNLNWQKELIFSSWDENFETQSEARKWRDVFSGANSGALYPNS